MILDITQGLTLYGIARELGVGIDQLYVVPGLPGESVWSGGAEGVLRIGDQVMVAQGPSIRISGPSDTFYSIARTAGLDRWQDLQVLRMGQMFGALALPGGLQPGDEVIVPLSPNCCGEGEEAATPTSEAEAVAVADGSPRDADALVAECDDRRVIVIDPGHGGTASVSGSSWNNATAVSGVREKTLTLQFAQALKAKLESPENQRRALNRGFCDLDVVLTRESDVNVTSAARRAVAAENGADIFISIHFNGSGSPGPRGPETWIRIVSEGAQSNESADRELASAVHRAAHAAVQGIEADDYTVRGVKRTTIDRDQGIGVLRDPGVGLSGQMCRSTLLEAEFITNPDVDRLFVSGANASQNIETYMEAVAQALIGQLQ